MPTILIKYRDGSGEITERKISDLRLENETTLDAFCHLRNARRPFVINRIIHAINPDTGEILNPYRLVDAEEIDTSQQTIDALTWHALPAIKALKFFIMSTRGFREREQKYFTEFVLDISDINSYSNEELESWLRKLWCGDLYAYNDGETSEYAETLRSIPSELLDKCRQYAMFVAQGSGRKPIETAWLERIENEFSHNPIVKKHIRREIE